MEDSLAPMEASTVATMVVSLAPMEASTVATMVVSLAPMEASMEATMVVSLAPTEVSDPMEDIGLTRKLLKLRVLSSFLKLFEKITILPSRDNVITNQGAIFL